MDLVHRQWGWGTDGQTNPWTGLYTSGMSESFSSDHFAPLASQAAQTNTATSISTAAAQHAPVQSTAAAPYAAAQGTAAAQAAQSTTDAQHAPVQSATTAQHAAAQGTTAAQHAPAQSTTDTPTQRQASTGPVAIQTAANTKTTTSPTAFVPSLPGETASRSASDHGATRSSGGSTKSGVTISLSSGGLGRTVSLPGSGSTPQPTATGSSATARPIATGSSDNASSSPPAHRIGTGEIAGIVLGIVFALGLGGVLYYLWRRRTTRKRDSTFIQYPFSSDAAIANMVEVPPHTLVPPTLVSPNPPADWGPYTDAAESPAATSTFGRPADTSAYGGGLTMPEAEGFTLPYAWDHPPPSSEYVPPTPDHQRSTFRASRGGPGPSPRRSSFGSVAASPVYSSGVPDADRRPPSYSRY